MRRLDRDSGVVTVACFVVTYAIVQIGGAVYFTLIRAGAIE
jgi:hypothetical protein